MKDKQLHLLQVQYNGITLNNQDIDLMLIAGSNNIHELKLALSKITNIKYPIEEINPTEEEFIALRQRVYNLYLDTLTSRPDYIKNKGIELQRKVEYLKKSGVLTDEELSIIDSILKSSHSKEEIIIRLNEELPERIHDIYMTLRDFSPIEKTGVKSTTLEATRNLLEEIRINYNSVTIDEEAKYGKIVLQDGTFDFRHLQKSLDFAKSNGKQVRLNTLLFYMDCPEDLYELEKTEENKKLVKQRLTSYVDETTKFIRDNDYTGTVRSIDVFNELLNRFALAGETPYMYRGDIEQVKTKMPNGQLEVEDNIKSGWLKHLDIADLCEIIAVARQNLPDTDFMYNDDNLIDPNKLEPTMELLQQIRAQEDRLGVKLIDSIGTQMHIDNGMTKDQMRDMIISLSKFGLPIEITEFDMVMTNDIKGLSNEEIEALRQQKINEIYECVTELKKDYDIRGFTIWSKTDKQNFRVNLANEERIPRGLEPIESMYGGYYTEEMQPKGKTLTKNNFQTFNYHTHTYRCGHAGTSTDREYVENARQNGIMQLGFTDHVPVTDLEFQDDEQQMDISEVDAYIESIEDLQAGYPDMTILKGFEVEYNPMKEQFLGELREKVDYMILGQHFVPDGIGQVSKNNPNYPLEYANMVCQAMESGIFDIVAHPDIFMKFRDNLKTKEERNLFLENAKTASRQICGKAKEMGIPLELNFGGIIIGKKLSDGEYAYPHSLFWEIAAEENVPTMYGVDAHHGNQFDLMANCKEKADTIINPNRLNLVSKNYNPVEARENNEILNAAYKKHQAEALSYETHLISYITNDVMERIPNDGFEPAIFSGMSSYMFDAVLKNSQSKAEKKKSELINKGQIATQREDTFKQERTAIAYVGTERTISNQKQVLQRAKETIAEATEIGCSTKAEFRKAIKTLTEQKSKSAKKTNTGVKEIQKGPVLIKKKPPTDNKGYVNTLTLIFVITAVIAITYILLSIK
ncbi:MAG: endo-1,4-beta-xylanase [Bacilli bacterium]|nr:endo-1,4-beta-xylanase [Bacilli bacterium]